MKPRGWIAIGAILGAFAIGIGAFGAHSLRQRLEATSSDSGRLLEIFETGARYQMYHALALVALGLMLLRHNSRTGMLAGWSLLLGVVLFSGSLYGIVLLGKPALGMITPIGGLSLMIGWGALAAAAAGLPEESRS